MSNLIDNLLLCAAAFAFLAGLKFFVAAVNMYRRIRTEQDIKEWEDE